MLLHLVLLGALLVQMPSWLDEPTPRPWNQAAMAIPTPQAPDDFSIDPLCLGTNTRWAENAADQALVDAGWTLFAGYRAGWGVAVINGTSGFDGMCRPVGYHEFVFVDGVFAGTLSPDPMSSRSDGAGDLVSLRADSLSARFVRYAPTDPLCCPSLGSVFVEYRIDRLPEGAVLAPFRRTEETP